MARMMIVGMMVTGMMMAGMTMTMVMMARMDGNEDGQDDIDPELQH